ncbi:MAG: hypothetical protein N3G20_03410 [Verrucomicrobiae bacterium]|nr:hypothetical protein [Verrucomicrobiae bacterium]
MRAVCKPPGQTLVPHTHLPRHKVEGSAWWVFFGNGAVMVLAEVAGVGKGWLGMLGAVHDRILLSDQWGLTLVCVVARMAFTL